MARIGITLDENFYEKFKVLSSIEGKKPSTLAFELVKEYIEKHDAELVEELVQAAKSYDDKVEQIRTRIREKDLTNDE